MNSLSLISILVAIAASLGAWCIFPYTISKSQEYRTSTIDMWCKRISYSFIAGFGTFILLSNISTNKNSATQTSAVKPNDVITYAPENIQQKPKGAALPPKQLSESHHESEAIVISQPTILSSSPIPSKIYGLAEISEMEKSKQYSGDDPIVRARLGLPSRETGLLQ